jgi:hypothetical protein
MGRPAKWHFDQTEFLTTIYDATHKRRAELEIERAALPPGSASFHDYQWLSREIRQCDWMPYVAADLVGHPVDSAEQRAVLRFVSDLERAGLVCGCGPERLGALQLTDKGLTAIGKEVTGNETDT